MASKNEVAARIMEHLCEHSTHGYSQPNRTGYGTDSITVDGVTYTFANGDRDCSSAVISAYEAAGVNCGGATYTGNMRQCMCGTGNFEWMPMSYIAQRGDIYLNEYGRGMPAGSNGHTAMCASAVPDMLAEFSGDYGNPQSGDQTDRESHIGAYYDCPWDGILRYVGGGGGSSTHIPTTPDLRYRVRTAQAGWLPEMVNWNDSGPVGDHFAGNPGQPITYIAMDMMGHGWYQVCTEASGWLPRVTQYSIYDEEYGCAGDGSPITAVRCNYYLLSNETGECFCNYQVANIGADWFKGMVNEWDPFGSGDDFAGNYGRIDRFRARLMRNPG